MNSCLRSNDLDSDKLQQSSDNAQPEKKIEIGSSDMSKLMKEVLNQKMIDKEVWESLPSVARFLHDRRIVYNSFIAKVESAFMKFQRKRFIKYLLLNEKKKRLENSESILMQKKSEMVSLPLKCNDSLLQSPQKNLITQKHYPYALSSNISPLESCETCDQPEINYTNIPEVNIKDDLAKRFQLYDEGKLKSVDLDPVEGTNMRIQLQKYGRTAAERSISRGSYYKEDTEIICEEDTFCMTSAADSSVPVSNVGCKSCGALLHCMDSALPGIEMNVLHEHNLTSNQVAISKLL